MADGIITPCNVARSWHWFRQVTAPCNVACGSGIMTVNSPSGSTLQCDTWLCDDMPLNSPGGSTLQCGRWLRDDMPWNSPKRLQYWNSTSGFDFDHITAVDISFCTSLRNLSKSDRPQQKIMTSCRFSRWRISAILNFRGPEMGSLKSPCTTSYIVNRHHSSKLLTFWENRVLALWRQDPRWRICAILDFRVQ